MLRKLNEILKKYARHNELFYARMDGYKIQTIQSEVLQLLSGYDIEGFRIEKRNFNTKDKSNDRYFKFSFGYAGERYKFYVSDDLICN